MQQKIRKEKALKRRIHRLKLSHGRTRRPHRKLHRSKKLTHKIPHRKMKSKRRHTKIMKHGKFRNAKEQQRIRNNENKNSRFMEKNLVKGVNRLMRQEKQGRVQMFNDWKRYYDQSGRQNIVI